MMNRFIGLLFMFVFVPFITSAAVESTVELTTRSLDDAGDNLYEYFDPQNEEEAYKKLATSFPSKYFSPDQEDMDEDEHDFDTSSREIENMENDEVKETTTILMPTEVSETTIQLANINETETDISHGQVDNNMNNTYLKTLFSIPSETDDEPVYHSMSISENNAIHKSTAAINATNETYNDDDYVNDGAEDDLSVTKQFIDDTTTVPLASPSSLLITRTPQIDYTITNQQTVTNSPSISSTQNSTASKKSAKKFETTSRIYKYSADEVLRKYLEDSYIRAPLAALINTSPEALRKAKILWKSTLRPNTPIDIVLLAFNSSGVGVTYSFKNTRTMIAGLDSVQESREMIDGGSGFYGIMRASELVPYDSAIFISTDQIPEDSNLVKYAAITLLKKRIRLYLIWFGDSYVDENETSNEIGGILGEVALRSGGEIFRITEESLSNGDLGLVTHFLQNDIHGAQILDIPINSTARNLQIKISGNVEQATLTTPNGITINLLDKKSLESYSPGSHLTIKNADFQKYEIKIILNIADLDSRGIYTLKIIPHHLNNQTSSGYSVIVKGDIQKHQNGLKRFNRNNNNGINELQRNVAIYQRIRRESELELQSDETSWNDDEGEVRILSNSFYNNNNNSIEISERSTVTTQYETRIEMGLQSQLLANPGSTIQLYYEITNLRNVPTFHTFQVTDERRFLQRLNPDSMWLPPGQMSTAVVTCIIPQTVEIGAKDKITFATRDHISITSQSAILTVTSPATTGADRRRPLIWWNYGSRCDGRTNSGQCAGFVWSLEITASDYDSGILRLSSNPKGLLLRNAFIAGTTQEVKATYTASCCAPRVTITAYDLAGNQRSISVDVTEYILNPAEIAAITLGVILILILIGIIIALIVYCCKKRESSHDLPVYRSRLERERNT